ncbi:MAG: hypothetical protein NXH97_23625 [Rhodobacteraceae bacterium]|nr:hypothetical protein [Paracoccaceae bacterium]
MTMSLARMPGASLRGRAWELTTFSPAADPVLAREAHRAYTGAFMRTPEHFGWCDLDDWMQPERSITVLTSQGRIGAGVVMSKTDNAHLVSSLFKRTAARGVATPLLAGAVRNRGAAPDEQIKAVCRVMPDGAVNPAAIVFEKLGFFTRKVRTINAAESPGFSHIATDDTSDGCFQALELVAKGPRVQQLCKLELLDFFGEGPESATC